MSTRADQPCAGRRSLSARLLAVLVVICSLGGFSHAVAAAADSSPAVDDAVVSISTEAHVAVRSVGRHPTSQDAVKLAHLSTSARSARPTAAPRLRSWWTPAHRRGPPIIRQ